MRSPPPVRRPHSRRSVPRSDAGGTLLGIFIGLALGLVLASVVAWTLMGGRLPGGAAPARPDAAAKDARAPKAAPPDKPGFDFYKILPGTEEPKLAAPKAPERTATDKASVAAARPAEPAATPTATEPSATKGAKATERYWLQAGSFAQQADAEQLKARLALAGWEAQLQPGTLPDKGVRYRVRLGPYDNSDELNRVKNELGRRGFEAAVIKQ